MIIVDYKLVRDFGRSYLVHNPMYQVGDRQQSLKLTPQSAAIYSGFSHNLRIGAIVNGFSGYWT